MHAHGEYGNSMQKYSIFFSFPKIPKRHHRTEFLEPQVLTGKLLFAVDICSLLKLVNISKGAKGIAALDLWPSYWILSI